ncbi:MmcQ/YjbR family DNA-binding protein [Streptomyces sp. MnatMP-M17]|uniref:MmcQ/YjbR family DNA-binding protein n=1 Tax=unclassified Streptomyces TaxID=2593676 RepID=UPI00081F42FF|nr:MmcQ/YjbR family DNA-binding protein [Streptomyces sp. MnatMP-M17]MYZ36824.1 MmcQ/YjbR family DNA-binding protein [Streptomyces sp. SID4917]SCF86579.1 Predicted DNA-binding protein, MmcQ/YjbR family [Streptomyces sp. MnatMP-M17]
MTPEELRAWCLGLNGTSEDVPFPRSPELTVFRVGGKIFAFCSLEEEPLKVALKCDPEEAIRLREAHTAIVPGWHLNKRHWNTVTVGELPARMVRELIEDSYDLVVAGLPRAERLRLDRP